MSEGNRKDRIILVRALTPSDFGWFAAHRKATASKQRAVNINADHVERLLSQRAFRDGVELECRCLYAGAEHVARRRLWKVGKNWRLGGAKLDAPVLAAVTPGDFLVLVSPAGNDGSKPVEFTFVTRAREPERHEVLGALVTPWLRNSMAAFGERDPGFGEIAGRIFPGLRESGSVGRPAGRGRAGTARAALLQPRSRRREIPPIPREEPRRPRRPQSMEERVRERVHSPHIVEQMLRVSSDLSAAAQHEFMQVMEAMAAQMRSVLVETGRIIRIKRDHRSCWAGVAGKAVGFVDGGMANLAMLGSTPVAIRVGGYVVIPGSQGKGREKFLIGKQLIDELYASVGGGVYSHDFPDPAPLRDAARITVEAAGAARIVREYPDTRFIFLHGALVNPVSRYTDIIEDGVVRYPFPNFSERAIQELLPESEHWRTGRDANFINVYLRVLKELRDGSAVVCGVVERESIASSVFRELLDQLPDRAIAHILPKQPQVWKNWFNTQADTFRITDSLLFRCVLEPGEVLRPVPVDRNELRRAPDAWRPQIARYPKPFVSYMLPSEWSAPFRLEVFERHLEAFEEVATLLMHCALLLPRYAFPVGLDIVDRFARVPDWMTRPVNTNTAVQAMKRALDSGDSRVFDALRRMLCGSSRDWLFRPKLNG